MYVQTVFMWQTLNFKTVITRLRVYVFRNKQNKCKTGRNRLLPVKTGLRWRRRNAGTPGAERPTIVLFTLILKVCLRDAGLFKVLKVFFFWEYESMNYSDNTIIFYFKCLFLAIILKYLFLSCVFDTYWKIHEKCSENKNNNNN